MSAFATILVSIVSFVAVVAVLVIVHEFGHYIAAKLQGFGVEVFSIGWGTKRMILWEYRKGAEAFQIRALPIGGFVRLMGESGYEEDVPDGVADRKIFFKRKRWERFLILVMGAAFNILFAYGLYVGLAWYGIEEGLDTSLAPRVAYVVPGSAGQAAGIREGDVILSVDGRGVSNWQDVYMEIMTLTRKSYPVIVRRGERELAFRVTPGTARILKQEIGDIGLIADFPTILQGVGRDSPAERAGIRPGDEIVAIDGNPVQYWGQLHKQIAFGGGTKRELTVKRDGGTLTVAVTPEWNEEAERYMVGVQGMRSRVNRYPFPSCFAKAGGIIADQSLLLYRVLKKLFTRKIGMNSLSGPVGIAYIAGQMAQEPRPFNSLLHLLAMFSLQLGILNLLPIPVLDGGHIFILAVEGAIRRDLPDAVKERLLQLGIGLLLIFFLAVFIFDILKFFPG